MGAMKLALEESGLKKGDMVNAHATSTPLGDDIEASAVKRMFGGNGEISGESLPYLTSNKGSIGHLLAAAGAVEAVFTCLSVQNDIIPHTLNLVEPSTDYGNIVMKSPVRTEVNAAISNSFGFGG